MRIKRSTQECSSIFPFSIIGICLLFLLGAVLLLQTTAHAAQITLAWDESDGATGYKIYSGTTSNSYEWVVDVGNVTSYTTSDLTTGYTYYFAATAYDETGLESDFSDEVSYTAGTVPCSYSISPSSASFNATGGTGTISVVTQTGCSWTAVSSANWFTITSGSSGIGSGTISYTVASNTGSSRTSVSTIAGQSLTLTQSGTQSYTITSSAGIGGTISPSGSTSVNYGANQTYTITPNSGYAISSVTVDGTSVGAVSSYTFSNVTAAHSIAATFTANTYTLTTSKTGTGTGTISVSPTGSSFSAGTVVTLTATAGTGSTFAGWSGACSGTATTCSVTMNSNTSVSAAFTLKTYTITASAGIGGTISPSGSTSVNYGASQTYTITPRFWYRIKKVTVDGVSVGAVSSYTFTDVKAAHTIRVTFGR